ncbi:hypothetical protein [Rhodobacteraceae bacterium DSL-40]|uniref:hypothetical protein n=1 Tax=Amaricoccus sp. B4 TaxID=3368557 RepID=UPI0013A6FEF1
MRKAFQEKSTPLLQTSVLTDFLIWNLEIVVSARKATFGSYSPENGNVPPFSDTITRHPQHPPAEKLRVQRGNSLPRRESSGF